MNHCTARIIYTGLQTWSCSLRGQQAFTVLNADSATISLKGKRVHRLKLANKFVACDHLTRCHSFDLRAMPTSEKITISKTTINNLQESVEEVGFHLRSPQLAMDSLSSIE